MIRKEGLEQLAEAYATNEDGYFDHLRYVHFLAGAYAVVAQIERDKSMAVFQQLQPTQDWELVLERSSGNN